MDQYKTSTTSRRLKAEELDHINDALGTNFKQVSSELIYKRIEKEKENAAIRRAKIQAKGFKGLEERFKKLTQIEKPKKVKITESPIQQIVETTGIVKSPAIYDQGVKIDGAKKKK